MALLNWILLIAVLAMVAHEQHLTSFTNTLESLVAYAKDADIRLLAWEQMVTETLVGYAAIQEQAIRRAFTALGSSRVMDYVCH